MNKIDERRKQSAVVAVVHIFSQGAIMLDWLAENVAMFRVHHNAHREFNLSVADHLHHRARIGNAARFPDVESRDDCVERDELWELQVKLNDGATIDVAGHSLASCVAQVRRMIEREALTAYLAA